MNIIELMVNIVVRWRPIMKVYICAVFILDDDDDADVLAWPNEIAKKIQF